MTQNGESAFSTDLEFQQALWEVSGHSFLSVDEMHQLVKPNTLQIREVISSKLQSRIIVLPANTKTASTHGQLLEKKLPVFSGIYEKGLLALFVPEGAQPMTSILTAISREPHRYGALFRTTGQLLQRLHASGFGVPAVDQDTLLFDRLAFATSENTPSGIQLYLVPPYVFDTTITPDDLIDYVGTELEFSNLFSITEVNYLTNQVDQGWNESAS